MSNTKAVRPVAVMNQLAVTKPLARAARFRHRRGDAGMRRLGELPRRQ